MTWARLIPAGAWLKTYTAATFAADARAAVIVTVMLVPQSLAYAQLAGLPPVHGLYASIAPLVAYAVFGSSRVLAVGPVAVVSLMCAAALAKVAVPGTDAYAAAALTLALLSGAMLTAMGLARLGIIATLLSHPVMSGFVSASAVLIALGQVRHLLGVAGGGETLPPMLASLADGIGATNAATLALGAVAVVWLAWSRAKLSAVLRRVGLGQTTAQALSKAAPIVAVAAGIAAVTGLNLTERGVKVVGVLPGGLVPLTVPALEPGLVLALAPSAVLIALVGFVESVSVAQALAARRRQRIEPDAELVGLGAGNIAAAFTGGFPVTGGFARSVVNFEAGAETPMAGVLVAAGMMLAAGMLTPLLANLPQAVLAATIVVAVLSLVDVAVLKRTFAYSKADFAAMATTIALVWVEGVEAGIAAGVLASLLLFLWRTMRPHMAVVGQVPGTQHFRNVQRHVVVESDSVLSVRVDMSLYFVNARYLEDRIYDMAIARPGVKHVVLMCSAVNFIDASALDNLASLMDRLSNAGLLLHLSEVKGPVMDRLSGTDFLRRLTGQVFRSQYDAYAVLDPVAAERAAGYVRLGGGA